MSFSGMRAATGLVKATMRRTVHHNIKIGKVSARRVLESLPAIQAQQRVYACRDLRQNPNEDPAADLMASIVACDKLWLHFHEPETVA